VRGDIDAAASIYRCDFGPGAVPPRIVQDLHQLIEIAIGPCLAEGGARRMFQYPPVMRRASVRHVFELAGATPIGIRTIGVALVTGVRPRRQRMCVSRPDGLRTEV
jgi:hypothetical protein